MNISQLFDRENFFRVPAYQRPYSWDDDNLSDLINDLIDAPGGAEYFLGTLVLHSTNIDEKSGVKTFDIVDGQQRLTSICLLLACIRDSDAFVNEENLQEQIQDKLQQKEQSLSGIPERNRLHARDLESFNKVVLKLGGTKFEGSAGKASTSSEQRFQAACNLFHDKLRELTTAEVVSLAELILQKCVVVYLAASSFEEAFRLFTVVNDRGQQLRRIDVLKANNLAPNVIDSDEVRAHYANKWEQLEESVGPAVFEDIFHSLRIIYTKDKPKGDLLSEFESRILGARNYIPRGTAFVDTLSAYVTLYDSLFVARDYMDGTSDSVRFTTMMTAMVDMFGANEWRAVILQFARRFGQVELFPFLMAVEKIFLLHWVKGMRKDERYSAYTDLLKIIEVADAGSAVIEKMVSDTTPIVEACRATNFYGASHAKYLLVRAEIRSAELTEPRRFTVRSIEHVLPQNPNPDSEWMMEFSPEDIDAVVHMAGNLVLLSKSKNSAAQNRDLAEKKRTYLQPRVTDFPRSVEVLAEDSWTRALIEARTENFATTVLIDP